MKTDLPIGLHNGSNQSYNMDDNERDQNYQTLLDTEEYLRMEKRITEDWVEMQKNLIRKYRDYFSDFSQVHQEYQDTDYRALATLIEQQFSLIYSFVVKGWSLDITLYYEFTKNFIRLVNYTFSEIEMENELSDSLTKFCMNL